MILCQGLLVDLDFNPRFKLDYIMIIIDRDFVDECPGILLIVFVKLAWQTVEESHHFIYS